MVRYFVFTIEGNNIFFYKSVQNSLYFKMNMLFIAFFMFKDSLLFFFWSFNCIFILYFCFL